MLVSSTPISRDLFPYLTQDGAFAVGEVHMFATHWLLTYLTSTLIAIVNGHKQSQTGDLSPWNYAERTGD
ncbi:hypothetical protein [Rhizobium lusitanum]|uniref:Uncharacterized protein n=1 Tax=Rhizobium lusitanum TaxID=293958 RepID=A0A7X0IW10_9HYPH|nr:hypothetical protein [Rhizobium lusitanum]MBB6487798.1 hypothetical protein [Rhizobium lusitanum]